MDMKHGDADDLGYLGVSKQDYPTQLLPWTLANYGLRGDTDLAVESRSSPCLNTRCRRKRYDH